MEKATREIYKTYLFNMLNNEDYTEMIHDGNLSHAVYMIDDVIIGGGFYDGMRSVDHYALLEIDYSRNDLYIDVDDQQYSITWDDILTWGIVIVPETESYISDYDMEELESIGYERLPLDSNHIKGC